VAGFLYGHESDYSTSKWLVRGGEVIAVLSQYLDSVRDNLRLDRESAREVINELETHIEDEVQELKEAGLTEEEAANNCMALLGSAKSLARQIYEAHSQGTWKQALLASMPHLLFALLFALNWWQGIGWVLITLGLILSTAFYGWWRGKPVWLFPWLGYSLLPVAVAGLVLLYLPKGWSWWAIGVYVPLALWLVGSITVQTIKRDWLHSALMLLPVPIVIGWFLAVEQEGKLLELNLEHMTDLAPWIGRSFLALALTVVVFMRLRRRWLKAALLFVSGPLTLIMVACYAEGRLSLPALSVLIPVMVGLLLGPALIERGIRRSQQRIRAWEAVCLGRIPDAEGSHIN